MIWRVLKALAQHVNGHYASACIDLRARSWSASGYGVTEQTVLVKAALGYFLHDLSMEARRSWSGASEPRWKRSQSILVIQDRAVSVLIVPDQAACYEIVS